MVNPKKELCTIFLDPDGASDNRDDLVKTLYSLLFTWLNEHINQCLCCDDFSTSIGFLDLPRPQNLFSWPNTFNQFAVNFANEWPQNWIQKWLFKSCVEEYTTESISQFDPPVPYFNNTECIKLFQNRPGGLVHIMDDQARWAPKKTDQTMAEAFGKCWGNHSSFKVGLMDRSGYSTCAVHHFNGPVTYSSENFLECNLDALNPDFISLLHGSNSGATDTAGAKGSGSINPFVKGLFLAKPSWHRLILKMKILLLQPNNPWSLCMHLPPTEKELSNKWWCWGKVAMRRKMKKLLYLMVFLALRVICPTEHVFITSELQSHSTTSGPNNVYTSICGEVFNLNQITYIHSHIVSVVPTKSILKYGSVSSDNIFPVQVSFPML